MDVLKRGRAFVAGHVWAQALCVSAVVFLIYYVTRQAGNPFNQYVLLADAFLDGRIYLIDPPNYLELAPYGSRAYVIDPPAPTIFLMPFVAIFGKGTDHVLVSCGVGALAAGAIWTAGRRLWTDARFVAAMTILVALGTNLWWLASDGGFWSFAHTSAVFFLAVGLVEAAGKKRPWLVGLFVGLAGLSRLAAFLNAPLFLYLVLDGELRLNRRTIEKTLSFCSTLGACALAYLTYNYARYGTVRDLGYYHPRYANEPWFQRGRFDITYIPRHIRAIFYEMPLRRDGFPYFAPKAIGTALILTTPAYLYALRARVTKRNVAAILTALLVFVPLLTHGVVGFNQFGYRFSLDLLPSLLLLTASGMRERLSPFKIAVLGVCVLMNLWGTLSFNIYDWTVF